jgi:nicotinate phosphoribosyltransferase
VRAALLTDLYEFTMLDSYIELGMTGTAVFEFFVRRLPPTRNYLVAAGLETVIEYLQSLTWSDDEVRWLRQSGCIGTAAADYLRGFRFDGDVDAMPEGTPCFADEPLLRIAAALPAAQLVESRIMNILHYQTLIASKASRCRCAAGERLLVDFGFRRSHGGEAGLWAARASYIAGFDGTATVCAGFDYGIPLFGTMAHSFVQAHARETDAFRDFLRTSRKPTTLLVDTYDTLRAVSLAADAAVAEQARSGRRMLRAVRLDSGDLAALARQTRRLLDSRGLHDTQIFCSGGLDEIAIADLLAEEAPIDGFGVGTSLDVSADAPYLDCAYKLEEYDGIARRKRSTGKATWPGRKQVWRRRAADGTACGDVLGIEGESSDGEALLRPVLRGGLCVAPSPDLATIRDRARSERERLPAPLLSLRTRSEYPVTVSDRLKALAEDCDRRNA